MPRASDPQVGNIGALQGTDCVAVDRSSLAVANKTTIDDIVTYAKGHMTAVDVEALPSTGGAVGNGTDQVVIHPDGTVRLEGAATVWNDINISLVPAAGQASALPTVIPVNGDAFLDCYAFNGTNSTPDETHGSFEVLHDYKEGSDISFHVHWAPTTAAIGVVNWQLRYVWFNRGSIVPAGTTVQALPTTSGVPWQETSSSFTISGVGKEIGSRFIFCLYRDPVGVDTYAADVAVFDIGCHYEKDAIGSSLITTK